MEAQLFRRLALWQRLVSVKQPLWLVTQVALSEQLRIIRSSTLVAYLQRVQIWVLSMQGYLTPTLHVAQASSNSALPRNPRAVDQDLTLTCRQELLEGLCNCDIPVAPGTSSSALLPTKEISGSRTLVEGPCSPFFLFLALFLVGAK